MISRARSTSARVPPAMTSTGAPSSVTRAERRVGSRLAGRSTVTPGDEASTTMTSSPAGSTRMVARPPPRTPGAVPAALPPVTVMSEVERDAPEGRPVGQAGQPGAPPTRRRTQRRARALAMTVGTKGPGAMARPSSSTTTVSSGSPKPDPPLSSGRWSPSQPSSASSLQNGGRPSRSASSRDRAAPRASRLARKSEAVWPRARWSSVMAIGMPK